MRIFITGGAKRIGKAIALYFAKKKWSVAIQYKTSQEEAFALKKNHNIMPFYASLEREEGYSNLINDVYQNFGEIDVLVHNAASFLGDDVFTCTRQSWDQNMETNLRAPFVLSQMYVNQQTPKTKNIIFMVDQRVLTTTNHFLSYTLSKSALWNLTKMLALSYGPHTRVNAVGPGPVLNDVYLSKEQFDAQCARTPLKKAVDINDIPKTIEYLTNTSSLTGQMIAVDSGQHLKGF